MYVLKISIPKIKIQKTLMK